MREMSLVWPGGMVIRSYLRAGKVLSREASSVSHGVSLIDMMDRSAAHTSPTSDENNCSVCCKYFK